MPFYIRKAFSLGPLRFNLSKSGLGLSAGVKGLRVGVNAKGKSYLQAGRGGLYYRQSLEDTVKETPESGLWNWLKRVVGRGG